MIRFFSCYLFSFFCCFPFIIKRVIKGKGQTRDFELSCAQCNKVFMLSAREEIFYEKRYVFSTHIVNKRPLVSILHIFESKNSPKTTFNNILHIHHKNQPNSIKILIWTRKNIHFLLSRRFLSRVMSSKCLTFLFLPFLSTFISCQKSRKDRSLDRWHDILFMFCHKQSVKIAKERQKMMKILIVRSN